MDGMLARSIAPEDSGERGEPPLTLEQVHVHRSKIVEKCAEAERHILWLLQAAGARCTPKALLSRKIEALKTTLERNPPQLRSAKLKPLLERLTPLSDMRSRLVHSTVTLAPGDGEMVAVFRSVSELVGDCGDREIMTRAQLKGLFAQLSQVANGLKQECAAEAGLPLSRE